MLNSISWSQFFQTVGILVIVYYGITFLLLFRAEIKSIFKGKPTRDHSGDAMNERTDNLLGQARSQPKSSAREEYVASDSLHFSRPREPGDPINNSNADQSDDDLLTGTVADLLEEIKIKLSSCTDWNKDEVFGLLRELLGKYPQLKGTVYQDSISYFISTKCSDHFNWQTDPEEIETLWQ